MRGRWLSVSALLLPTETKKSCPQGIDVKKNEWGAAIRAKLIIDQEAWTFKGKTRSKVKVRVREMSRKLKKDRRKRKKEA